MPSAPDAPSRRRAIKWALLAGLSAGCTSNVRLLQGAFDGPRADADAYGSTDKAIAELPYATLGVEIADQDIRYVSVLAGGAAGRYTWAAPRRLLLVTENGRLVSTRGLPRNLAATRWIGEDPLRDLGHLAAASAPRVYREVDLEGGRRGELQVAVESEFKLMGRETIRVLGRPRDTVKVRETVRVRQWRWEADNFFWIDPERAFVWRSRQAYCPEIGDIRLEVLKRPSA